MKLASVAALGLAVVSALCPARGPKAMQYVTAAACSGRSVRAPCRALPQMSTPVHAALLGMQAIDATRTFGHQGYCLLCNAKAVNSGNVPALVVCRQVWPIRPGVIAIERGDYLSEDTAIDAAHAQGVKWIQNFG
jgi:hypothetical protein